MTFQNGLSTLQDSIQAVVRLLWADNREVPLIAAYHKEAAGELLAMRREDQPETTDRNEARRRTDRQLPEAPEGTVQVRMTGLKRVRPLCLQSHVQAKHQPK